MLKKIFKKINMATADLNVVLILITTIAILCVCVCGVRIVELQDQIDELFYLMDFYFKG